MKCIIKDNAPKEWSDVLKIQQYEGVIVDVDFNDKELWDADWSNEPTALDDNTEWAYMCTFPDGKKMRIRSCCLQREGAII